MNWRLTVPSVNSVDVLGWHAAASFFVVVVSLDELFAT